MSKGYIIGGGGSTKLYACIGVTYPAGSVCTCTNGTKTLKAKGTSGTAIFNVPSTGTWTVTATNGDKTASKSVSITAEGQTVVVELLYTLEIINGTDTSVSGGWAATSGRSTALSSSGLYTINDGGSARGTLYMNSFDATNLAKFNTLKMSYTCGEVYSGGDVFQLRVGTTKNTGNQAAKTLTAQSSETTVSIDISGISSGYPYINQGQFAYLQISRMWLE